MKFKTPGVWIIEPMTESFMEENFHIYTEDMVKHSEFYEAWLRGKKTLREKIINNILDEE